MITQGILLYKLEQTDEPITPHGGLALFAEVLRTLKVRDKVRAYFPRPGSNRGYEAWAYLEPLLLMLEGGGRHVEEPAGDSGRSGLAGGRRAAADAVAVDVRGLAGQDGDKRGAGDRPGHGRDGGGDREADRDA